MAEVEGGVRGKECGVVAARSCAYMGWYSRNRCRECILGVLCWMCKCTNWHSSVG